MDLAKASAQSVSAVSYLPPEKFQNFIFGSIVALRVGHKQYAEVTGIMLPFAKGFSIAFPTLGA